jgi:hypothetical protein
VLAPLRLCKTILGMAAAAAHSVQLLADVIALEFSQSLTSEQCAGALRRLLPGLQYLSIAVTNPAQPASIVASANCAVPGPTTLHLHDATSCAAGLALARGEPLQASLAGEAPEAVHAWTDVQQMAAAAPAVTHLLCVPFGANHDSSDCISDGGEETRCPQHAPVGSGCGALMFGLAQQPRLSERQAALLARLARSLPAPMARLSGDALAFVNFATGNVARCSCCCDGDSEGEEGGGEPGSPCGDGRRSGGGGGVGPSQAVPVPAAVTPALQIEDGAECSRQQGALRDQLRGKGSKQAAAAAQQPEPVSLPQHPAPLVGKLCLPARCAPLQMAGRGSFQIVRSLHRLKEPCQAWLLACLNLSDSMLCCRRPRAPLQQGGAGCGGGGRRRHRPAPAHPCLPLAAGGGGVRGVGC